MPIRAGRVRQEHAVCRLSRGSSCLLKMPPCASPLPRPLPPSGPPPRPPPPPPGSLLAKKRALTELVKGPSVKMMPRWLQSYARDPSVVVSGRQGQGRLGSRRVALRSRQPGDTAMHKPAKPCPCPALQAPSSCRTGRVVVLVGHNNKEVPVRLTVEPCQVGRMRVLTATGSCRELSVLLCAWRLGGCIAPLCAADWWGQPRLASYRASPDGCSAPHPRRPQSPSRRSRRPTPGGAATSRWAAPARMVQTRCCRPLARHGLLCLTHSLLLCGAAGVVLHPAPSRTCWTAPSGCSCWCAATGAS